MKLVPRNELNIPDEIRELDKSYGKKMSDLLPG